MSSCCQPSRGPSAASVQADNNTEHSSGRYEGMALIPGGSFRMGNDRAPLFPGDGEGPVREVDVDAFRIGITAVTNAAFGEFVAATGYVTDAERYGWSYVFVDQVAPDARVLQARVSGAPWWRAVERATWHSPTGPSSQAVPDHPVVHVSWNDAQAFASWTGTRLPTEAEWEKAARGGLDQKRYPWGDDIVPGQANVWEGDFPVRRTNGPASTIAADALEPNGFGLHNVSGNVWEWTSSEWASGRRDRVVKGGSYLCHPSYCHRYRVAGRTFNAPDSSTSHTGFRVAATA